jgi:hypothetical protein
MMQFAIADIPAIALIPGEQVMDDLAGTRRISA